MKNILVPIDGSQFSNLAMDKAKEFADVFGSTVTLLYVDDSRQ
jgi:nucleotide-binding universal stress UspA family protein